MNDRNNDDRKIDALVNHPETRTVEFKAARETFSRDEAINYCVAIANEGGGELVLGVTDKLPRQICGSNAIPDLNAFELLVTQKTKLNVVAREIKTASGRVVIFQIPRRRSGEPVENDGKCLVRRGESLVPMRLDALGAILDEAKIAEESLPAGATSGMTKLDSRSTSTRSSVSSARRPGQQAPRALRRGNAPTDCIRYGRVHDAVEADPRGPSASSTSCIRLKQTEQFGTSRSSTATR